MILELDKKRALELIEKFARFFVEKRLGTAAIMTIESLKPIYGLTSQAIYTVSPFIEVFFSEKEIQEVAVLLNNREYVDLLVKRVDELDEELHREERKKARQLRKRRRKKRKEQFQKIMKKLKIINKK